MKLSSLLIQNNYSITLAALSVDGHKGTLSITQTAQQIRTDVASVVVKPEGEKVVKQKINTMVEVEGLKEYTCLNSISNLSMYKNGRFK